jgi:three-Cys-motif partner protein
MGDMRGKGWGGEWTKDKLERLRNYLRAYTTALKNQPFELIYIDVFAGTGYWAPNASKQREEEEFSVMNRLITRSGSIPNS